MFLLYSTIILFIISNNFLLELYSFKVIITINYIFTLFLYLKLQCTFKNLEETKQKLNTFYNLYNIESKKYLLTNKDKSSIHNQIIILNTLLNHIKSNDFEQFYTTIQNQLHILFELRSLSLTPYHELNYMLSLYKVKLKSAGINLVIQIEPFKLNDKDLYDFIFCISQFINYLYDHINNKHYIDLLIKQNKFYIICIIKTNTCFSLSYDYKYIKDIIKRYDGKIIPFYNNHFSGYKLYFKASL
jgi:hypothetical protein